MVCQDSLNQQPLGVGVHPSIRKSLVSEVCPLSQVEVVAHTIPLLIISQGLAAIQACMREFGLRILEPGTQRHFQIMSFRVEGS